MSKSFWIQEQVYLNFNLKDFSKSMKLQRRLASLWTFHTSLAIMLLKSALATVNRMSLLHISECSGTSLMPYMILKSHFLESLHKKNNICLQREFHQLQKQECNGQHKQKQQRCLKTVVLQKWTCIEKRDSLLKLNPVTQGLWLLSHF